MEGETGYENKLNMYHTNIMVVRLLMSLKEWGLIDFSSVRIRYLG